MNARANSPERTSSLYRRTVIALSVLAVIPCAYGFGIKFYELFETLQHSPDGVFVVLPMLNYLLATTGFLALFVWATLHGMFRDIESPKYTMLERERWLDELETE